MAEVRAGSESSSVPTTPSREGEVLNRRDTAIRALRGGDDPATIINWLLAAYDERREPGIPTCASSCPTCGVPDGTWCCARCDSRGWVVGDSAVAALYESLRSSGAKVYPSKNDCRTALEAVLMEVS